MTVLDDLASATLRIECGSASGSGFQFLRDDIIVTNCHVTDSHLVDKSAITAWTGDGRHSEVAFAGFPHGVPDLLVHRAFISGFY